MRKTSDDLTSRLVIAEERVSELRARVSQQKPPKLESKQNKNFPKKKRKEHSSTVKQ